MATLRQINSPGVQITEVDKSQYAPAMVGTNVLLMGFAPNGQALKEQIIPSVAEFESGFGKPTNEAERYANAAVRDCIGEGGVVHFIKLPYDNTMDTNYKAVGFNFTTTAAAPLIDCTSWATLSAEKLTSSNWTSTGWTGDFAAGFDHTDGNTTALSNTLAAVASTQYKVSATVAVGSCTTAGFVVSFGGASSSTIKITCTNILLTASTTTNFAVTPETDFDGAIVLSVKSVIPHTLSDMRDAAELLTGTITAGSTTFTNLITTDIPKILTMTCGTDLADYKTFWTANSPDIIAVGGVTTTKLEAVFSSIGTYETTPSAANWTLVQEAIKNFYTGSTSGTVDSSYFTNYSGTGGIYSSEYYNSFGGKITGVTAGNGAPYVRYFFEGVNNITDTQNSDYTTFVDTIAAKCALEITTVSTGGKAISISDTDYDIIVAGNSYNPSTIAALANTMFTIVAEKKQVISGMKDTDETDGMFVAIVDPIDAMKVQRIIYKDDNDIMEVVGKTGLDQDDTDLKTYTLALEARVAADSVSEQMSYKHPVIEFTDGGTAIDNSYVKNYITFIVARTVTDPNNEGKTTVQLLETFSGSLDPKAKNPINGQNDFILDKINSGSLYVKAYRNSASYTTNLFDTVDAIPVYGDKKAVFANFTRTEAVKDISAGKLSQDIDTALEKVSNLNELDIDLVIDAGLSSIAQFCVTKGLYDPDANTTITLMSSDDTSVWRQICTQLDGFCRLVRKDCMAILDVPRQLVLKTDQKLIRPTAPANTFSNTIMPKLRFITGLSSSYSALYSDWSKVFDAAAGKNIWIPQSIKAAATYLRTDRVANIWDAPAGLNRGNMYGISDIAFNPKQKESDQLYPKGINYAMWTSNDGFWIEGQRTTQTKPTAFDRVNVRRLFLRLERQVYKVARYFVDEPNNTSTRTRFVATIDPLFSTIKNRGGLYDYMIVCDATNNTPTVIDNNEMRVAILLKPVKTAEFILVDFIAVPTGGNFAEYLG